MAISINLSILDFKQLYKIRLASIVNPINLSILDFKQYVVCAYAIIF